jgi:hypothetical protein
MKALIYKDLLVIRKQILLMLVAMMVLSCAS